MFFDKPLFIGITNFKVTNCINQENDDNSDNIISSFEKLCQIVFILLIMKQIPINIQFIFKNIKQKEKHNATIIDKCNSLYLSYFEEKALLSNYKQPKCNKMVCLPLKRPIISLSFECIGDHNIKYYMFKASNCTKIEFE